LKKGQNNLTNAIIDWYSREKRPLPWRENTTPYHVWLSEIILQQTRVAQGLGYFMRFLERFPTVEHLAAANEEDVLKIWEGLGYYSRARNLHKTARLITKQNSFPTSYDQWLEMPGVGPYTAAAIASICFNEPKPVLDGNVFRVVSRLFGVKDNIAKPASRRVFLAILQELIPHTIPGEFNQGIMELGALCCTPYTPHCPECPVRPFCYAYKQGNPLLYPVKVQPVKIQHRYFHYMVFVHQQTVAMHKRGSGDIWQGLYDFHLLENDQERLEEPPGEYNARLQKISKPFLHLLSHQKISAVFYKLEIEDRDRFDNLVNNFGLIPIHEEDIVTLPKPKLIVNYLKRGFF